MSRPALPPGSDDGTNPEATEESDELSDAELGELFEQLPEGDDDTDLDAEDSSHLDVGVETDELTDEEEELEREVDVGADEEDLLPVDDLSDPVDETADGALPELELLPEADDLPSTDDAEGLENGISEVAVPALPPLEVDDGAEGSLEEENVAVVSLNGDEPRPTRSTRLWTELTESLALEACSALAVADAVVVAASTDLLWFTPGSLTPIRLEAGSSRIRSLALTATGWEYAVCATSNGRLLRRGRLVGASEELHGLRDALPVNPSGPDLFDLCQPGAPFSHALLVRNAAGTLVRSDDDGLTFRRVTERRVRAVSPGGAPALAVTVDGALLSSDDGGGSFREIPLPPLARDVSGGRDPMVAGHGSVVALAEPDAGILVSIDGGRSFERVAGSIGVTAVCCGELAHSPSVWAALYDETDRSWLIQIDPASGRAETIAVFESSSLDDEDGLERSRVARLEWEPQHGRLWVVGGFGIKALAPAELAS